MVISLFADQPMAVRPGQSLRTKAQDFWSKESFIALLYRYRYIRGDFGGDLKSMGPAINGRLL